MSHYTDELNRIKKIAFNKQWQIDTAIAVRGYIDEYYSKALNLDLLSQEHSTSKYHLLRLFKRYYGLTPRQHLIDKRIEHAKSFLAEGKSVTEVCHLVGFESVGSFSTLFKTKTGSTPTQFQKSNFQEDG